VQRDRATPRSAETARCHVVRRHRATLPVPIEGGCFALRSAGGGGGGELDVPGLPRRRVPGTARRHVVQGDQSTQRRRVVSRKTARRHATVLVDRVTPRAAVAMTAECQWHHAERPRDVTLFGGTAKRQVVQRDLVTSRRAQGPRDATWCRGTARRHVKGTARRHVVQRNRATPRHAQGPRDAAWCRETARCHVVHRDRAK